MSVFDSNKGKAIELYLNHMDSDGNEEATEKDFEFFNRELSSLMTDKYKVTIQLPTKLPIQEIVNSFNLLPEDINLLISDC